MACVHGDTATGSCPDCRQSLCVVCVAVDPARCPACQTAYGEARARPPVLWAVIAVNALGLLGTAGLAMLAFSLAAQSQAGELSAFQQGMVQGMGFVPEEFGVEQAAYFAGTLFPMSLIRLAYVVGVFARWRRPLYGVLALDVLSAVAGLPCCLVGPALMAALILNKKAQNHLRT